MAGWLPQPAGKPATPAARFMAECPVVAVQRPLSDPAPATRRELTLFWDVSKDDEFQ
jgi:hypothetical protein